MAITTDYGNVVGFIPDALSAGRLNEYVASALEAEDATDDAVIAATDAYREALNAALAEIDVQVSGTEVYGPYPRISKERIAEIIAGVDFWEAARDVL